MREIVGDLWTYHERGAIVAVTTNGATNRAGWAVMGRGCAREAAERYPDLPVLLGQRLRREGNRVYWWPDCRLITFPTKHHWRDPGADLDLIRDAAYQLRSLIDVHGWMEVVVPRPGCGVGRLNWERSVRPILRNLWDDRVLVIGRR